MENLSKRNIRALEYLIHCLVKIRFVQSQSQTKKEIALDLAGPFEIVRSSKKYWIVSADLPTLESDIHFTEVCSRQ